MTCSICGSGRHRASRCPVRPRSVTLAVAALAVGLAGCETVKEVAMAPIVVDNFCLTAKKRTWSIDDTPETVREAQAWNAAVDKRCGVAKPAKPSA